MMSMHMKYTLSLVHVLILAPFGNTTIPVATLYVTYMYIVHYTHVVMYIIHMCTYTSMFMHLTIEYFIV